MVCLPDRKALLTMVKSFDKEVKDLTPEDRATINLGEKAELPRAYRIPTLDEVLAVVPKDRVLQSEIKLYGPGYARISSTRPGTASAAPRAISGARSPRCWRQSAGVARNELTGESLKNTA